MLSSKLKGPSRFQSRGRSSNRRNTNTLKRSRELSSLTYHTTSNARSQELSSTEFHTRSPTRLQFTEPSEHQEKRLSLHQSPKLTMLPEMASSSKFSLTKRNPYTETNCSLGEEVETSLKIVA